MTTHVIAQGGFSSSAPGIFALAIGLIGAIAVAVAYYRTSLAKATIDTLKESNAAFSERNELLEGDLQRCQRANEAMSKEVENLRGYVSGAAAVDALANVLRTQHDELMERLNEVAPRRRGTAP